jgi:hypothetical protein
MRCDALGDGDNDFERPCSKVIAGIQSPQFLVIECSVFQWLCTSSEVERVQLEDTTDRDISSSDDIYKRNRLAYGDLCDYYRSRCGAQTPCIHSARNGRV